MATSGAPRQGDHVFNDLSLAFLRPFEILQSLSSSHLDGRHFLNDYLLHAHSFARLMAEAPPLTQARTLAASAGDEDNALSEIARLRARNPALARINAAYLRTIHEQNSTSFGSAGHRYDVEVLTAIQQALEAAIAPANRPAGAARTASAGIACQQMIAAAYDPAAALVVVTASASQEPASSQANFHRTIVAIADSLDKPATWKEPYENFWQNRHSPSPASQKLESILAVFRCTDGLKSQSSAFTGLIANEIRHKATTPGAAEDYSAMLHLLHMRLQQVRN